MTCTINKTKQTLQVVACITQVSSAWRLLNEAVEQARSRDALLRLVICQRLFDRSHTREDFFHFFGKIRHAALQTCREHNIQLIVENLDCGDDDQEIEKLLGAAKTELLIISDSKPSNKLLRWIPRKEERIARMSPCSVLVVR